MLRSTLKNFGALQSVLRLFCNFVEVCTCSEKFIVFLGNVSKCMVLFSRAQRQGGPINDMVVILSDQQMIGAEDFLMFMAFNFTRETT